MYSNQNGPVVSYEVWITALASSAAIGFTSLVPWLFNMTFFERHKQQHKQLQGNQDEDGRMKFLLGFAVGAILGDIFLHLIPESLDSQLGLWIIAGIFMFIIVEMILEKWSHSIKNDDVAGYLSLIANSFDNFTHGLAIGASFLVGPKVGLLTTFVIFIHEIPHEICDYAILVNSGFSRWDAVKAQSSVSLFGILGTALSLYVKSAQTLTVWILPFSAGGFLYIALVNLLPEILYRKTNNRNSFGQVVCVTLGIAFVAAI